MEGTLVLNYKFSSEEDVKITVIMLNDGVHCSAVLRLSQRSFASSNTVVIEHVCVSNSWCWRHAKSKQRSSAADHPAASITKPRRLQEEARSHMIIDLHSLQQASHPLMYHVICRGHITGVRCAVKLFRVQMRLRPLLSCDTDCVWNVLVTVLRAFDVMLTASDCSHSW